MEVVVERCAGIDVHKDMIKVAIRSPGEKPWTRKTEVLQFRTFYGVLRETARELRRRGVTHVVMEASGVYTGPVYYALAAQEYGASGSSNCNSSSGKSIGSGCVFNNVTLGSMDLPCYHGPNCYLPSGTLGVLSTSTSAFGAAYGTGNGWNFATGLGSVNAANLVNNW